MIKYCSFIFLIGLTSNSFAQKNTQKGLNALTQANFGLAKAYFYKDLKKDSIAAAFGLSVFYSQAFSYEPDSALYYLNSCSQSWKNATIEEKNARLKWIPISDSTIQELLLELAQKEYAVVLVQPSIDRTEKWLTHFGKLFTNMATEAILFRDSLAYEEAMAAQTAAALKVFISSYPDAIQHDAALALYDQLWYQEQTSNNSELALASFIVSNPSNPFTAQAWMRLYAIYAQQESITAFAAFIESYPNSPYTPQAWKQIHQFYLKPYSAEKLAQFKIDYPTYPFLEDLAQDAELLLKKMYPFLQDDQFGYTDQSGQQVIAAQFDDASAFVEGLAVVSKNSLYGLINKKNENIVDFKFLDITATEQGYIAEDSSGFYFLSRQGQFLQQKALEWEELQQTLLAMNWQNTPELPQVVSKYEVIQKNGKVGLNKRGKNILPAKYEQIISPVQATYIFAKIGKNLHYFDSTGKRLEINDLEWFLNAPELASFTKENVAIFSKGSKLGLLDTKGRIVVKNSYDAAQPVYAGLWPVQQNGKWGLVSTSSKVALPFLYDQIVAFPPFGFLLQDARGVGLVDSFGKVLLQPEFKAIKSFESDLLLVENQNGLGLYNKDAQLLIECAYQRIIPFDERTLQLSSSKGLAYYFLTDQKIMTFQP